MTIYDIAKAAGVSASTVSRVINNKKGVSETTRKKIQELLKEYNFTLNETARGLVSQSSGMIGILISDIRTVHHTDGAYYIERELAKLGYCGLILNTGGEEANKAHYIHVLSRRRVEGAVLIGSTFQTDAVKQAIRKYLSSIPVVIANGYLDLPNVYGILADEQNGVSDCVELLYKKGRKKPAFIIDEYTPSNKLKLLGFKQSLSSLFNIKEPLIYETESSLNGSFETTIRLMNEHPDVDAIIYAVDLLAVGGLKALASIQINVPEKVSVIGIDNSIYTEISTPRLTSLDNKLFELSVAAARNLIDALQGRKTSKKMLIFSSIVERETT